MPNRKSPTTSELNVNELNTSVFFKEFTFAFENFVKTTGTETELADNIVQVGNVSIIYQVKERNAAESTTPVQKWFLNKVLNKAVKQIKTTIRTLNTVHHLTLKNNRGHEIEIKTAGLGTFKKVIVYDPHDEFPITRFQKLYVSDDIGTIHLFHYTDYIWICKFLGTPKEVDEYLDYREVYLTDVGSASEEITEQYVLAQYFCGGTFKKPVWGFTDILEKAGRDVETFDVGSFLIDFVDKQDYKESQEDYYNIIREIAMLRRSDLKVFNKQFRHLFKLHLNKGIHEPFRFNATSGCGFIFIALYKDDAMYWKTLLKNFALSHQYDQRLNRCIGLVVFKPSPMSTAVHWIYVEKLWNYNVKEKKFVKKMRLRKVKVKPVQKYIYKEDIY